MKCRSRGPNEMKANFDWHLKSTCTAADIKEFAARNSDGKIISLRSRKSD